MCQASHKQVFAELAERPRPTQHDNINVNRTAALRPQKSLSKIRGTKLPAT